MEKQIEENEAFMTGGRMSMECTYASIQSHTLKDMNVKREGIKKLSMQIGMSG